MDNGKVVGVWAKDKSGEKIRINAKAVLLLPAVSQQQGDDEEVLSRYPDITPVGKHR